MSRVGGIRLDWAGSAFERDTIFPLGSLDGAFGSRLTGLVMAADGHEVDLVLFWADNARLLQGSTV